MKRSFFLVCAAVGLLGCSDGGDSGPNVVVDCDLLRNWAPGEEVGYRFSDPEEEWLVAVSILSLRPGHLRYSIRQDQLRGGDERSEGSRELNWEEQDCPPFVAAFGGQREQLVFGEHSTWGTLGLDPGQGSLNQQSCEPGSRTTPMGTFPVNRCAVESATSAIETVVDDFYAGSGAAPGGGFIAREVFDVSGRHSLALLEYWNGR